MKTREQATQEAKRATADGGSAFVMVDADQDYFFMFSVDADDALVGEFGFVCWVCDGQIEDVYEEA